MASAASVGAHGCAPAHCPKSQRLIYFGLGLPIDEKGIASFAPLRLIFIIYDKSRWLL
jgi:hypothetical protein